MRASYPRTPHLPWSPGATADDVRTADLGGFAGREVVVTEKLDGENTTLYADGLHARSLDSAHHPSRTWAKALQGRIGRRIPVGWRVCGENVFARHSLGYGRLDGYFYAFSVWDARDRCLDWDATVRFARGLGVPVPRVLWRGVFDERALRGLTLATDTVEGFVVRTVEGFGRGEFGARVAKWVRPGHVTTGGHWMLAPVVPNGLGPDAVLWDVRSGAAPDAERLCGALELRVPAGAAEVAGEAAERLDLLGRTGDARLSGVLAALAVRAGAAPGRSAGAWARRLGMPLARRVAVTASAAGLPGREFADARRRAGLLRLAAGLDVGVLHAVAAAVLAGRPDAGAAGARERVEWSALHAQEAGLLRGRTPLEEVRAGLREALAGLPADAADRCWARAREAFADGRINSVAEAVALTWGWRSGAFPRLVQLVGPSGSGKSRYAAGLGADLVVSMDDLREARGSRTDQSANSAVFSEGLDRVADGLRAGGTVVWDATSLGVLQRGPLVRLAARYDALVTQDVLLVPEGELAARNARRAHPVPAGVLARQLARFDVPRPGEAHRVRYVGAGGTVEDVAGTVGGDGEDGGLEDVARAFGGGGEDVGPEDVTGAFGGGGVDVAGDGEGA